MDRKTFEVAIRQNWNDYATRAVFADWLDENGFHVEAVVQRNFLAIQNDARKWLEENGYFWKGKLKSLGADDMMAALDKIHTVFGPDESERVQSEIREEMENYDDGCRDCYDS